MNIAKIEANGKTIAVIEGSAVIIDDVQSALDFMATVQYEADCDHMVVPKSVFSEDFFDLTTGLAGEVLQKFVIYRVRCAVVGDFSTNASASFQSFIRESNQGTHFFFLPTVEEAVDQLASA